MKFFEVHHVEVQGQSNWDQRVIVNRAADIIDPRAIVMG